MISRRLRYVLLGFVVVTTVIVGLIALVIRLAPPTSSVTVGDDDEAVCFVAPPDEAAACAVDVNATDAPDLSGGLDFDGFGVSKTKTNTALDGLACMREASGDGCLRFPTISGLNLLGDNMTLPADFAGEWTLVIVPFSDEQQVNAQSWLPLAEELSASVPTLRYYNVPIFPDISAPIRLVIRAGMTVAIADTDLQAVSITVFLDDRETFLAALNIPDVEAAQILLLNDLGEVFWRGIGEYDAEQAEAIRAVVESIR